MNIIKSFFCNSDGKFQPPYFWITILMIIVVSMIIMRIFDIMSIDNTIILGMSGLVVGWLGLYNTGKKK